MNYAKNPNAASTTSSMNSTNRNWFSRLFNRANKKTAAAANETSSLSGSNDIFDMEEYHNPMLGISQDFIAK